MLLLISKRAPGHKPKSQTTLWKHSLLPKPGPLAQLYLYGVTKKEKSGTSVEEEKFYFIVRHIDLHVEEKLQLEELCILHCCFTIRQQNNYQFLYSYSSQVDLVLNIFKISQRWKRQSKKRMDYVKKMSNKTFHKYFCEEICGFITQLKQTRLNVPYQVPDTTMWSVFPPKNRIQRKRNQVHMIELKELSLNRSQGGRE